MFLGKLCIERIKNSKGLYEFGFWFNVSTDEFFCINFGISFIKSFQLIIYWEQD